MAHVSRVAGSVYVTIPPRSAPGFSNVRVLQQLPAMSQISNWAFASVLENSAVPVLMEMLDTAPDEQNITIIVNAVQRHSLLSGDYNCNVLMFSIFINVNCFTTSLGLSFEGVL